MQVSVKSRRKQRVHVPELGDDTTTVFSSPQSMDSAERDAVKSGENRGKKMAMLERPEHYGCIGNTNNRKLKKGTVFSVGGCEGCKKFNPDHKDVVGAYCKLSKHENCIR